jgi:CheY-like chemotaxis protein/DNA-directed RNA polymerase specialized sigma24 family protein
MTYTAQDIVAKLPYLRRYARALTGSQAAGDQYVRELLEVIIRDKPIERSTEDLQRELFRLFHKIYSSTEARMPRASVAPGLGAESETMMRQVMALPSVERQVLLLAALERYAFGDVGYILGIPETAVREIFNRAQEAVTALGAARVLIIEDEPVIALELRSIVESLGHTIVGTADRERDAIDIATRSSPDLVLADIQLRGSDSGIEAVREILKKLTVPVIFITAFPERLLTGQGVEPTFILSKPYDPGSVRAAISQALFTTTAGVPAD